MPKRKIKRRISSKNIEEFLRNEVDTLPAEEYQKTLKGLLDEEKNKITYRPSFTGITGGTLSAILLQQIYHWWSRYDEPFYKYRLPCDAPDYRPGDSWCEELGFTEYEFDKALKDIAQRVSRKIKKNPASLVWYWVTIDRHTYYEINFRAFNAALVLRNRIKPDYVVRQDRITESDKTGSDNSSETNKTEITPEKKLIDNGFPGNSPRKRRDHVISLLNTKALKTHLGYYGEKTDFLIGILGEYARQYVDHFGVSHPRLRFGQVREVVGVLDATMTWDLYALDEHDTWVEVIAYYFDNLSDRNDGSICAFLSRPSEYDGVSEVVRRLVEELEYAE